MSQLSPWAGNEIFRDPAVNPSACLEVGMQFAYTQGLGFRVQGLGFRVQGLPI